MRGFRTKLFHLEASCVSSVKLGTCGKSVYSQHLFSPTDSITAFTLLYDVERDGQTSLKVSKHEERHKQLHKDQQQGQFPN